MKLNKIYKHNTTLHIIIMNNFSLKKLLNVFLLIATLSNSTAYLFPNTMHSIINSNHRSGLAHNRILMISRNNEKNDRRTILKNTLLLSGLGHLSIFNSKKANALFINEDKIIHLYDNLLPSICYINTEYKNTTETLTNSTNKSPNNPFANQNPQKGIGSGFFWDNKGHIVTNFHVINKVDNATVIFTNKKNEYKEVKCKLVGIDPDRDIAVLKINTNVEDYAYVRVSSNDKIKIGQYAFAIGNPFAQNNTMTMGIVSGKNRRLTAPSGKKIKNIIQTDASINPGNSGGPLFNSDGKLIAMNTASMGLGVSCGVNFAVSVDMVKETVDNIIKYGTVKKPILGITYLERSPTRDEAEKANIPYVDKGVIVLNVPEGTPAYNAGMRGMNKKVYGDIIVAINNDEIRDVEDFTNALEKYKPNEKIIVKTIRGYEKTPMQFEVILGEMEDSYLTGLEYDK